MRDSLHVSSPPGNSPTLPSFSPLAGVRSSLQPGPAGLTPGLDDHLRLPSSPASFAQTSTHASHRGAPGLLKPRPATELAPALLTEPSGQDHPHPYFSSPSRLIHDLLMKGVKPSYQKKPEIEPNPAFSAHLSPYAGQTIFGLTPPPLIGTSQPQLPRREGLSSSKKGPSSHLSLSPSSSLKPLPLNPTKFMAAAG